jgi:hypothetical protein
MDTPSGPHRTPEQRIPEHLRVFLDSETIAGHFEHSSHAIGREW